MAQIEPRRPQRISFSSLFTGNQHQKRRMRGPLKLLWSLVGYDVDGQLIFFLLKKPFLSFD